MGRRLMLVLTCALIVGIAMPAYAEVQNIKVSGDILVQGVNRAQMDLATDLSAKYDDQISALLSTVRLRVDADLTDNVSVVVRLINERVWSEKIQCSGSADTADTVIELDLAYMTLKEFLYEPLTLIIGRQNLRYGNGFIVGDPDTNQFSEYNHRGAAGGQLDTIIPEDLSAMKAFDAIRAILNYDPLVIDLVFSKIDEATVIGTVADRTAPDTSTPESDDVDLWGVNVAYDWGGDKNLQTESYIFWKEISSDGWTEGVAPAQVVTEENNDRTITLGTKATLEPIERLYVSGEFAWQTGKKYIAADNRDREAFAYQLLGQYALDMKYDPIVTVVFTHLSGDKDPGSAVQGKRSYKAWDPMFEDQSGGKLFNALFPASNCNVLEFKAGLTPIEDVGISLEYAALWLDEAFADPTGGGAAQTVWNANDYEIGGTYNVNVGKKSVGHEIDLVMTYDYTEDVQFGLNTGVFMPGELFTTVAGSQNRENAYQVIGSVKVSF